MMPDQTPPPEEKDAAELETSGGRCASDCCRLPDARDALRLPARLRLSAYDERKKVEALMNEAADEINQLEHRIKVIAADVAAIRDEWLESQPQGIRDVIANVRRFAVLSDA